ncbi:MAG: type IV pilus assembly protein PilM [Lentisphaeria bacterium]|nr:type IV pilus assembly protein PilM [Lentisphaeria bacterium]
MAALDLVLCLDIGANSIKAAEFSYTQTGELLLERFAFEEYGIPSGPFQDILEGNMDDQLQEALIKVIKENNFQAKKVNISFTGHDAYIRFVKVPSMVNDEKKIKQIIEYEAQSAIPYEMNEVVLSSQLLNVTDDNGEIEAMFVIVKSERIEKITEWVEALGKEVSLIEVAPTACYNAARLSGVGDANCELILDIGSRSSSLLFVDKGRLFIRVIPIAGHNITQQISKEFSISYQEAEEMKRRHGFVALGGAYEEPESEVAATVSKIVRNVMTRLHGEISRSINIYRSQQKGRKPEKLYLSGGSSVMGYMPRFFQEKLRLPVEYFNPFKTIAISQEINKEQLADVAHMFADPIGLSLRHAMQCPVEISLVPRSRQKILEFKAKNPYFYASAATLLLCLLVTFFGFNQQLKIADTKKDIAEKQMKKTKSMVSRLKSAENDFSSVRSDYEEAAKILEERKRWPNVMNEALNILPDNMWLTKFQLSTKDPAKIAQAAAQNPGGMGDDSLFGNMGGMGMEGGEGQAAVKDYISVELAGHGLVKSTNFLERLTKRLGNSKFFVFDNKKDRIDKLVDGVFMEGAYNVATFELTLKLKETIKK